MEAAIFREPAWYRALSLVERHALIKSAGPAASGQPVDEALVARRSQRWRSQPPFEDDDLFQARLHQDGVDLEQWLRILGESPRCIQDRCSTAPQWLSSLARSFARPSTDPQFPLPQDRDENGMLGFLVVVRPLLEDAWSRLARASRELPGLSGPFFDRETVAQAFAGHLPWQLTQMLSRTMILELNVARLTGKLSGESAEVRFASFIDRLSRPEEALELLQEYPLLARQLATSVDTWVETAVEFLRHLASDWDSLREQFFSGSDPGQLIDVQEAGDRHRGGRCVMIAKFSKGARIVYKPKSLAVDAHFQDLLQWLNARGLKPDFRPLRILDRGTYGWVEFVQAHGCETEAEIQRFYERQGGLLALLYVLEATDLHSENLLAVGEHPVFVDLETLFHPYPPDLRFPGESMDTFLDRSVLRSGLLPERIWTQGDGGGIDISGLGAELEQQTPFGVPRWEGSGTDEMRVVFKQVTLSGAANRPLLRGQVVEVPEYTDALVAGFSNVYRFLWKHRDELLASGGPIAKCAHDEVRVILRPTTTYCVLLRESFHPDFLRDGLDRDRLFDRLWDKTRELPYLAPVVRAEARDLWRGDVPVFTTSPDSRDIFSSSGECIPDYFGESALSLVRRRFAGLDEADLARQTWIVRGSLATLATQDRPRELMVGHRPAAKVTSREPRGADDQSKPAMAEPSNANQERLVEAARRVGRRLDQLAIRDSAGVTWVGLSALDEQHCRLELLGPDLYDGLPGVMLFLAWLGEITGEEPWTDLARRTLQTLRRHTSGPVPAVGSIGAFSGWGGVIYSLAHVGSLWSDPQLHDDARAAANHAAPLLELDDHFDIVSGAAGCLGGLASLQASAPSSEILALARRCGAHLLDHAQSIDAGLGWPSPLPARGPLTGFSHGASGIGWSLLELSRMTGEDRFAAAAKAAMDYERGLFSPRMDNWLDLREADESGEPAQDCVTAWCHGAPGIGLARLHYLRFHDDSSARADAAAAVRATLAHGVGRNHSLCHGDLGNLELLLLASRQLDPTHATELDRFTSQVLDDIDRRDWISGVPNGVESPGLMTGLAGIGYGLLRLAEPSRVPSVLSLARPQEHADVR